MTNPPSPQPRAQPTRRARYPHVERLATRWHDNDSYGHLNNAVYYAYFDTVVSCYLHAHAGLTPAHPIIGGVIGLVVESGCTYFAPMAFPEPVDVGLRVARIGTTSVRYELAAFRVDEPSARAQGHFVHVYVDATSQRPIALPPDLRQALQPLLNTETSP